MNSYPLGKAKCHVFTTKYSIFKFFIIREMCAFWKTFHLPTVDSKRPATVQKIMVRKTTKTAWWCGLVRKAKKTKGLMLSAAELVCGRPAVALSSIRLFLNVSDSWR